MLIGIEEDQFNSSDYIYALKLDGVRYIAYLDNEGTGYVDILKSREKHFIGWLKIMTLKESSRRKKKAGIIFIKGQKIGSR